jgi:hypothetical protein
VSIRLQPSDADMIALEWCDSHADYVQVGDTEPYEAGSRYRLCSDCRAASALAAEQWQALRDSGLDELTMRARGGDR